MKSKTCSYHKNRKMNDDTYKLRREVMNYIYEAKDLLKHMFKRVDIRITDCDRNALGTARMNDCIIWIPAATLDSCTALEVRHVVFHEIAHAIFGAEHDKNCKLMSPVLKKTTKLEQDAALSRIALCS